jgi:Matrixin
MSLRLNGRAGGWFLRRGGFFAIHSFGATAVSRVQRKAPMRRLTAALLAAAASVAVPAAAADFRLLELDDAYVKWGAAEFRSGADVTWGVATAERSFPDAINCGELAPIAELEAAWGADPARLVRVVEAAFAMWSREADLQFRPAREGETPDILIGAQGRPERIAFANVWHAAPAPGGAIAGLTRATICFNPELSWSTTAVPAPGSLDLGTVLAHEIGHAIGLDHPGATGALMGYSHQGNIDNLMSGDIAGARALYGRARD